MSDQLPSAEAESRPLARNSSVDAAVAAVLFVLGAVVVIEARVAILLPLTFTMSPTSAKAFSARGGLNGGRAARRVRVAGAWLRMAADAGGALAYPAW